MSGDQNPTLDRLLQEARTADEAGDAARAEKMAQAAEQLRSHGEDDLERAARAILIAGSDVSEKSTDERVKDAVTKLAADRRR